MNYTAFIIRKTRLEKNWSQEGLCKDICTASYLSKIEQGKAEPSQEIIQLLFARLGVSWNAQGLTGTEVEGAYDLLFSGEFNSLKQELKAERLQLYENSPWGMDYMLLHRAVGSGVPLEAELEILMTPVQLALQRLIQGRWNEAIRLYPCGYTYYAAGSACYHCGDSAQAIDLMNRANALAAEEGCARLMLHARMTMGSCYANLKDFSSMHRHYAAARRLARALGDEGFVESMDYNVAATNLEAGRYEEAMTYFATQKESNDRLRLHKLAICCEKLGRREEALAALDRAVKLPDDSPEQMGSAMCRTVYLRLTTPQYLDSEEYGQCLNRTFSLCRMYAPVGYCLFHMPWMLEWYAHRRQYKQVAALLMEFPDFCKNKPLKRE